MMKIAIALAVAALVSAGTLGVAADFESDDLSDMFSDEVCMNVCFPRARDGLLTCQQDCKPGENFKLPPGADYLVRMKREGAPPPALKEMTTEPAPPREGEPVTFKLVPVSGDAEDNAALSVRLVHSFDAPGGWKAATPTFGAGAGYQVWTATLDAPPGARSIFAAVRMGDINGDTYIEAPCKVDPRAPDSPCWFPLSDADSYEGVKDMFVDPALDLLGGSFGMDDGRYYFKLKARADISPGKAQPRSAYYYMLGLYDSGRPAGEDPYHRMLLVYYSPYMLDVGRTDCRLKMRLGQRWISDAGAVSCSTNGNELTISVKRGALGKPVAGMMTAFFASGIYFDDETGIISDFTPATTIRIAREPFELESR
jgi:hypothetical protein